MPRECLTRGRCRFIVRVDVIPEFRPNPAPPCGPGFLLPIETVRAAPRPCTYPGCRSLVQAGRCDVHRRALARDTDARRGSAAARGYGGAWVKARAAFLRAHPLCAAHEARGQLVAATVVDHITPHRGDRELFWQSANWRPLCAACHNIKTAREDGGFGRAPARGGGIPRATPPQTVFVTSFLAAGVSGGGGLKSRGGANG